MTTHEKLFLLQTYLCDQSKSWCFATDAFIFESGARNKVDFVECQNATNCLDDVRVSEHHAVDLVPFGRFRLHQRSSGPRAHSR